MGEKGDDAVPKDRDPHQRILRLDKDALREERIIYRNDETTLELSDAKVFMHPKEQGGKLPPFIWIEINWLVATLGAVAAPARGSGRSP